ncbi:copper chaperone PCu(A)C [Sphingomonas parva]|nr:copper chaperone PCu(A)C [Sphingomonas parva]
MKTMPLRPVLGLIALALATGCERKPAVTAEDVVITLPAMPGAPGAAYFRLETNTVPERLTGITSPAAERVELHETRMNGAMAGMAPLDRPAFDADRSLAFVPGGRHAMLFGVKSGLKPGDRVAISFAFEQAQPLTVEAEVRGPGQGHAGH